MSKTKEDEVSFYKAKLKKYQREMQEMKEQLDELHSKYVKVSKDKERYKAKIISAKEDFARFDKIVDQKVNEKASDLTQEVAKLKKDLKKRDKEISQKNEEIKKYK